MVYRVTVHCKNYNWPSSLDDMSQGVAGINRDVMSYQDLNADAPVRVRVLTFCSSRHCLGARKVLYKVDLLGMAVVRESVDNACSVCGHAIFSSRRYIRCDKAGDPIGPQEY